jgi:hypothetical protein
MSSTPGSALVSIHTRSHSSRPVTVVADMCMDAIRSDFNELAISFRHDPPFLIWSPSAAMSVDNAIENEGDVDLS